MKCSTLSCNFSRHTNLNNNGGTHCCLRCKIHDGKHGVNCKKKKYEEEDNLVSEDPPSFKYVVLSDFGDRLGSHISRYIFTICFAVHNKYKIIFSKPKEMYNYYNSVFVLFLFRFIQYYNDTEFKDITGNGLEIKEPYRFFRRALSSIYNIKCDFLTYFKENINSKIDKHFINEKYGIPFDPQKTIGIHLRLDDRKNVNYNPKKQHEAANFYRNNINNDTYNINKRKYGGQSALKESVIKEIIDKILTEYCDYEVIVVTSPNSNHGLPYKTIRSHDESYDMFLLSKCKILIGSASTFSYAAMFFGDHEKIYYPLWDHAVLFGLTTKYDKTKNIILF